MLPDQASRTARTVAAVRAQMRRASAPYGDPAADNQLQALVATSTPMPQERMARYLMARTRFFDAQVIRALDDDSASQGTSERAHRTRQVVIVAAGYDGRALRYAKPGVRWIELDHPATQADKLARLRQIGAETSHIQFVAADFAVTDVSAALAAAGCDPTAQSLVLAEGIAAYLPVPVLAKLLQAMRGAVAADSQLAISLSTAARTTTHADAGENGDDAGPADRESTATYRAAFQRRVAAAGEAAETVLTADQATGLLIQAGWQPWRGNDEAAARTWAAGLVTATAQ